MPYEKIVVTGCSHSTGYEMNDHLLGTFEDDKQRRFEILKWYKNNFSLGKINFKDLYDIANKKWHEAERESSWPALLQKQTGIPVINLSVIGASVGRSLLSYSNFLKQNTLPKLLVIHQLPIFGRMFLKFNKKYGRINVLPKDIERNSNFMFRKNFYQKEIDIIKKKYKDLIVKENYLEKHYKRIVEKLHYLSVKNNINDYFIVDNKNLIPKSIEDKVLINNFGDFLNKYTKGVLRHVIDKKFNEDMCKIVKSIF
jgi:hypothetical protein